MAAIPQKTANQLQAVVTPDLATDLIVVQQASGPLKKAVADTYLGAATAGKANVTGDNVTGSDRADFRDNVNLQPVGNDVPAQTYVVEDAETWAQAIASALAQVTTNAGGTISLPGGEIQPGGIVIGNGSTSQFSTVNAVSLAGVGHPFVRLTNPTSPLNTNGTRLKATGSGSMVKLAGPLSGGSISNIAFNGNSVATKGLELVSASNLTVENLVFDGCATGVSINTVAAENIGGVAEGIGSANITFRNCQWVVPDNGTGIDLDGYLGASLNGWDTVRVRFENCYMLVSRVGGTGVRARYTDQIDFTGLYMSGYGTANGNQASYRFVGCRTVPGNYAFPQNLRGYGNIDPGQDLPIVLDETTATVGPGISLLGLTLLDAQNMGTPSVRCYITAIEPGTGVKGGMWGEHGTPRRDVGGMKNRLLNSGWTGFSRGSPVPVAAGGYTANEIFTVYDGTTTATMYPVAFAPGQTEVPGEPLYYLEVDVTAASGNSFFLLGWRIPNYDTFSSQKAALNAWLSANVTSTWSGRTDQQAGVGGSGGGASEATAMTVPGTGVWVPSNMVFDMTSTAGGTRGTKDYLAVYYRMPINQVGKFRIACPQFTGGRFFPPYEQRLMVDQGLMVRNLYRFPCLSGLVGMGRVVDANTVVMESQNQMRFQPTVISSAAGTFAVGGVTCTAVPSIGAWSENGQTLIFTATAHGLTVGNVVAITTTGGSILLSAEY